jgi:peptidoglycan hydrolase CwlO-like protein
MKWVFTPSIMRGVIAMLAILPLIASASSDSKALEGTTGVAAIKKVIQMLSDMEAKAKKEKNEEEVAFAEFSEWCKVNIKNLGKSVKTSKSEIDELGTSIDKLASDAKQLGEEITALQTQIAKHEADMKARQNTREKERQDYVEESKNYAESISALDRAVVVMSEQDYDRKGSAAALLQVTQSQKMPERARELIASFLGFGEDEDEDGPGYEAPEANAYEFQSGSIVSLMKSLLGDFRGKKNQCDKEEANAHHAHNMVMMDLANTVDDAKKDVESKTGTKSAKLAKAASLTKQKKGTEEALAEDESTLKDTEAECSEKTDSFKGKQQLRADEIEAIGKAISIISSSDMTSFIQITGAQVAAMRGVSLAQLRSGSSAELKAKGKHKDVRDFIVKEGQRLKSRTLSLLVEKLDADPFAKVTNLIKNMLSRLLKEANEDAEQEGFCDTEMAKARPRAQS